MARSYRISVNGKSYDVVVEELGAAAPVSVPAPALIPAAAPAPVAPAPVAAPVPAPAAEAPKAPVTGGTTITAPMPGKIWKLHVREGDSINEGQLALVLEAMKMENEIFSPATGTVRQINCKEGDSVSTGDVLLVIG
ncbi:MAG: biotin/lipoyl-binding protein [Synergistaceae bacterium]|jgi:glutaconyl-CoA decarboxylase|nr:biotin/lipoyl-binding protein [Synergistaceae bacterium]